MLEQVFAPLILFPPASTTAPLLTFSTDAVFSQQLTASLITTQLLKLPHLLPPTTTDSVCPFNTSYMFRQY
jgi:hypothetical protein